MAIRNAGIALAASICCVALCAAERSIDLEFRDGRVWIAATDVPVRNILREWARLGGTTIVNGDSVEGPPVTLHLTGVSEGEALDTVLRETAGYVAVLRAVGADGPSRVKSILILPTSVAPAPVPAVNLPVDKARTPLDQSHADLPQPLAEAIRIIRESTSFASPSEPPSDRP